MYEWCSQRVLQAIANPDRAPSLSLELYLRAGRLTSRGRPTAAVSQLCNLDCEAMVGSVNGDGRTQFGLLRSIPGERCSYAGECESSPAQGHGPLFDFACCMCYVCTRANEALDEQLGDSRTPLVGTHPP